MGLVDPVERAEAIRAAWIFYEGVRLGGGKSYREVVKLCPINPKSVTDPKEKVYA